MATLEVTSRDLDLTGLIPDVEWQYHRPVVEQAINWGLPFALGGGIAFSAYSGRWRNTKDLDLFVLPSDRHQFCEIVTSAGFADYYAWKPYDRSWIFRGFRDSAIVDVIWTMPNHRMEVDESWLSHCHDANINGARVTLLPIEELIWSKLFVLQFDRTDWPDILNVLCAASDRIDWRRLIGRLNGDRDVLAALMCLFRWLSPRSAAALPAWIWERLGLMPPKPDLTREREPDRAALLDTRDWFGPKDGRSERC